MLTTLRPTLRSVADPHELDGNADHGRHELPAVATETALSIARTCRRTESVRSLLGAIVAKGNRC